MADQLFDEACQRVVSALKTAVPMAFWSISELVAGRQVYVHVTDDGYGRSAGQSHAWSDSLCQFMVDGAGPRFAPDAMAIEQYATAGIARQVPIGSYIGVSIHRADGSLYGTLCGLDPDIADADLARHSALVEALAHLMGQAVHADQLRAGALLHASQSKLRAARDPLTGLPNRTTFLGHLDQALRQRAAGQDPSVLAVRVDDLRAVTDVLGQDARDGLLLGAAGRISSLLPPDAVLCRFSSDEFAILLDRGDPAIIAQQVLDGLEDPIGLTSGELTVRATIGVAQAEPSHTITADELMANADIALQRARQLSTSRLARFQPGMQLPEAPDVLLRDPLRRAIDAGDIELHYQPIIDLTDATVVSVEALARWNHQGTSIPPDVFIPLAARAGLLTALTDHVLETACAQVAAWSTALGHHDVQVAVNISPDALADPDFPDRVLGCLSRNRLHARQLVLEVTEDALLVDVQAALLATNRLRELGVGLSLDDFGTGYSSLVHLRQIPLTTLKIDQAFTPDVDTDPHAERFMHALLTLGQQLGLKVIVEGVERLSQAVVLRRLGCRHAQGWLFARPAAATVLPPPLNRQAVSLMGGRQ